MVSMESNLGEVQCSSWVVRIIHSSLVLGDCQCTTCNY